MGIDMEINKAYWSSDGDRIRMSMPINKVDAERRIVSGFATLDNLDKQDDVVPSQASVSAFKRFRGNIREMHQPKAVGRMVSFKEDKFFDPETKKFYSGIYVSAYVSKGAQDTWEKVLDGTLTGFSIGGVINDSEKCYDEEMGKAYQVIKDYDLAELSLVDNPANQLANFSSIEKADGISKADSENVFWCRKDDIVQMSKDNSSVCPQCDASMLNIGFVESNDTENAAVIKAMVFESKKSTTMKNIEEGSFVKFEGSYGKVQSIIVNGGARFSTGEVAVMAKSDDPVVIIKQYSQNDGTIVPTSRRVIKNISSLEKVNAISKSEVKEVSKMDSEIVVVDEIEKSMSEAVVEPAAQDAFPVEVDDVAVENDPVADAAEDAAEGEVEKAAHADVETPEEDATETPEDEAAEDAKKADEASDLVKEITNTLTSTLATLAETVKALDAKIEGINKSVAGLSTEVTEVKDSFGKRVDAVEKDTAFRKSADLGEILQEQPVIMEKSNWGGRFLTNADLF